MLPKHVRYQTALHPEGFLPPAFTSGMDYFTENAPFCQGLFYKNFPGFFGSGPQEQGAENAAAGRAGAIDISGFFHYNR